MSNTIKIDLNTLVIFKGLRDDPIIKLLPTLFDAEGSVAEKVERYTDFIAKLFEHNTNLTEYLLECILENENFYIKALLNGHAEKFEACLSKELETLERISQISAVEAREKTGYTGFLPEWHNSKIDFKQIYRQRVESLPTSGYGLYSNHHMFCIHKKDIAPIKWPDPVRLTDFSGYEQQRTMIVQNTLAFINDKPAANALLYGDAGTGKSSTVKAIVNEYHNLGLRLIEIKKNQIHIIPSVIEALINNPLKFIIFLDDLSFTEENDDFYALKAILEGSAVAKTQNIVIYATSNRRHLIKERFSDREADDIHRNETIQELASLSHRFGVRVGFYKPNKNEFLEIVHDLAARAGLDLDTETLEMKATQFAARGFSPRAAHQFIRFELSIKD